jgi:cell cycle checkpoint protein
MNRTINGPTDSLQESAGQNSLQTHECSIQQSSSISRNNNTLSNGDSQEEEVDFVFLCKLDNVRIITNVLSALQFKKEGQFATVIISSNGIKFTVEENQSFQGNAFLQQDIFQEYKFNGGDHQFEQFRINLSILLDCLNIYGISSFVAMQMGFGGYGHSLVVMLEENGVITHCGLHAFDELDWSSQQVSILLSPDPPYFRLSTVGPSGSCQVDYPKDSEVFEVFDCSRFQMNNYKLSLLQPAIKALALSHKTQLRTNGIGILSLQHMIKSEDKTISFVDFFIVPDEVDDGVPA